jgi:hypothetical protein
MNEEARDNQILGESLVRRVMRMVAVLHARGLESLYLHCGMNGSGRCWRYSIGAMNDGNWPRRWRDPLQVFNSMDGSDDPTQIEWGRLGDAPEVLADKFESTFPDIATAARVSNPEYVHWYRAMLAASEPAGMLVFYFDYKLDPRPEFWGGTHPGLFLERPPGLASSEGYE